METDLKRQLDDVMADIKRLAAAVQQKLKGRTSHSVQFLLLCPSQL